MYYYYSNFSQKKLVCLSFLFACMMMTRKSCNLFNIFMIINTNEKNERNDMLFIKI